MIPKLAYRHLWDGMDGLIIATYLFLFYLSIDANSIYLTITEQ